MHRVRRTLKTVNCLKCANQRCTELKATNVYYLVSSGLGTNYRWCTNECWFHTEMCHLVVLVLLRNKKIDRKCDDVLKVTGFVSIQVLKGSIQTNLVFFLLSVFLAFPLFSKRIKRTHWSIRCWLKMVPVIYQLTMQNFTLMQTKCKHFSISSDDDQFASVTRPNFYSKSTLWRVDWIEPRYCHNARSEYCGKCQRVMRNCVYGISFKGELSHWSLKKLTWKFIVGAISNDCRNDVIACIVLCEKFIFQIHGIEKSNAPFLGPIQHIFEVRINLRICAQKKMHCNNGNMLRRWIFICRHLKNGSMRVSEFTVAAQELIECQIMNLISIVLIVFSCSQLKW